MKIDVSEANYNYYGEEPHENVRLSTSPFYIEEEDKEQNENLPGTPPSGSRF